MVDFYETIIGLDRLAGNTDDSIVFFRLGEGFGGHTQVLALFDAGADGVPAAGAGSSLHHIALGLPYAEQDAVMRWYHANGLPCRVQHFDWIGWRGVFTQDPEGNTVELVARDPDWTAPRA